MFEFLQSLGQGIVNGLKTMFAWLGSLFVSIFNGVKEFIATIFRPLILFFQGLWYLLGKCFHIVVLVIQVIIALFKVLGSIIIGIISTFAQLLGYSGSSSYYYVPDAYQPGWNSVSTFLNQTGLSNIAMVMAVFIWIMTAYAVIKIVGGER